MYTHLPQDIIIEAIKWVLGIIQRGARRSEVSVNSQSSKLNRLGKSYSYDMSFVCVSFQQLFAICLFRKNREEGLRAPVFFSRLKSAFSWQKYRKCAPKCIKFFICHSFTHKKYTSCLQMVETRENERKVPRAITMIYGDIPLYLPPPS